MRVKYDSLLCGFGQNSYFISLKPSEDNKVVSNKDSWGSLKRLHRDHRYDSTSVRRSSEPTDTLPVFAFAVCANHAPQELCSATTGTPKAEVLWVWSRGRTCCCSEREEVESRKMDARDTRTWGYTDSWLAGSDIAHLLFPVKYC